MSPDSFGLAVGAVCLACRLLNSSNAYGWVAELNPGATRRI
jgi:hypothetical protein